MRCLLPFALILTAFTSAFCQAPPPTQGVPFLRLVWARVADFNGELGSVECTEFSPDGRLLASATKYSNEIAVWRVADGTQVWASQADQEVERVAFSPDGKLLTAGGEDDLLRIFRVSDGTHLNSLKHDAGIDSLRWSRDGTLLATGEETGVVRLWRMPEGNLLGKGEVGGPVNELDFTQDGALLVAVGDPTGLRIFRTSDMSVAKVIHTNGVSPRTTGRFSPDDQLVAAGGHEGVVRIWRVADGTQVRLINFTGQKVESLTFSPDGGYLIYAGHDPHIRAVRIADGSLVHLSQPVDNAEYVSFSRNGSFLASAHQDGVIRLWVWMRGDAGLNKRLHSELMKRQAEEDARNKRGEP